MLTLLSYRTTRVPRGSVGGNSWAECSGSLRSREPKRREKGLIVSHCPSPPISPIIGSLWCLHGRLLSIPRIFLRPKSMSALARGVQTIFHAMFIYALQLRSGSSSLLATFSARQPLLFSSTIFILGCYMRSLFFKWENKTPLDLHLVYAEQINQVAPRQKWTNLDTWNVPIFSSRLLAYSLQTQTMVLLQPVT